MSDEAARLHAEAELARRSVTPVPQGILGRELKSIVHLNRAKYARIQVKPLRRRTLLRVHGAAPMLVVPARGADCAAIHHLRREDRRDPDRVVRVRPLVRRRRAAVRACRASARWEVPLRPSLFRARVIARERLLEGRRVVR